MSLHSEYIADVVDDLEEQHSLPATIVENLVKDFLMPRLAGQCQRREEQLEAHKFRVASRFAVEEAVLGALGALALKPESTSQDATLEENVLQEFGEASNSHSFALAESQKNNVEKES